MVRRVLEALAVRLVGDADLDGLERVEDVELCEGDLRERVEPDGLARHHGVEPPAPAAASGVGPELVAALDEQVAGLVAELGRERARAHPGDVGLGDPDDPVDVARSESRAGAGAPGDGVRRRHEGIGAVVEVEEGCLGPFHQDVAAGGEGVVDDAHGVADHGGDPRCVLTEVAGRDVVRREREPVIDLGQDRVLLLQGDVELLAEDLLVQEVLDAQAHAGRLVGVGGADAALSGAERVLAEVALRHPVELLVVRHDQVRVAAHHQARRVDALVGEHVDLREEHLGVDHHAVPDDRGDVVVEHARGHQLECERLAADDDPVPGVVAALVAHDQVHLAGEEVGELALALIAPLGPDHHGCRHVFLRLAARITSHSIPRRRTSRWLGPSHVLVPRALRHRPVRPRGY